MAQPELLADYLAVRELKHEYCTHLDAKRTDELFALFTDDAVVRSVGIRGTFEGAEEVRAWCEDVTGGDWEHVHLPVASRINVGADEATGAWNYVVFVVADGCVEMGIGEYEDRFRRVDGEWGIAERTAERSFTVDLGPEIE